MGRAFFVVPELKGQKKMEIYELRVLLSPAAGVVAPLQGIIPEDAQRFRGEGFALTAPEGLRGFVQRAVPAVEVRAPADGAVISAGEDRFRLRTGDGLELEVLLCAPGEIYVRTGEVIMAGECCARLSREDFCASPAGIVVRFPESSGVSELHVLGGMKKPARPAAEYRLRSPE